MVKIDKKKVHKIDKVAAMSILLSALILFSSLFVPNQIKYLLLLTAISVQFFFMFCYIRYNITKRV